MGESCITPLLITMQILDTRQELITRNFVREVDPTTPLWRPLGNKVDGFKCIGKESSRTSVSCAIV